jgi:hypothetical protein
VPAVDADYERYVIEITPRRLRAEGFLDLYREVLVLTDFENPDKRRSGWWDWKPAKRALEHLFMEGELTCIERQGLQKRYELTERFLPSDMDTREPDIAENADFLIDATLRAHGFATARTINYLRRDAKVKATVRRRLADKVRAGDLTQYRDDAGEIIYARPGAFDRAPRRFAHVVHILSPFDNVVIQRKRALQVFGFDYTIECYVPEAKRRFGYFALPLVYGDRFVGRMDCKAHRARGRFEIKALYVETAVPDAFMPAFGEAVRDYAAFTGCHEVEIRKAVPVGLGGEFRRLFGQ